jgi:hypothetical protein
VRLGGVIGSTDAEAIELAGVEAHELGGMLSAMNTEPASTKETACIELIGTAEGAATAEPEALETMRLGAGYTWHCEMTWQVASAQLERRHKTNGQLGYELPYINSMGCYLRLNGDIPMV